MHQNVLVEFPSQFLVLHQAIELVFLGGQGLVFCVQIEFFNCFGVETLFSPAIRNRFDYRFYQSLALSTCTSVPRNLIQMNLVATEISNVVGWYVFLVFIAHFWLYQNIFESVLVTQ